jgi:murein L,D-transpeptidase YafK
MLRSNWARTIAVIAAVTATAMLAGCGQFAPKHMKPLSAQTRALLAEKGMREDSPMLIRIFKAESELEIWKARDDGRFAHFKTYPICNYSGDLGPKLREGDRQAPEGFYMVTEDLMNPQSEFHLAFNIGYPNAYDAAYGRTGKHIMVHGDCKSRGCYAMTDAVMEEIYILAREALAGGQQAFQIQAYPFRMTEANLSRHKNNKWYGFWRNLKEGYDQFEATRVPPRVDVCERRYLINVAFQNGTRPHPSGACPAYRRVTPEAIPRAPLLQEASATPNQSPLPAQQASANRPLGSVFGSSFGPAQQSRAFLLGPATLPLR